MRARPTLAAGLLSLALVASGCSGSASDSSPGPTGRGPTTTAAPSEPGATTTSSSGPTEQPAMGTGARDWPVAEPAALGLDGAALDRLADQAEQGDSNCLLVARHGKIAGEWYWNAGAEDTPQEVFSATKSFASVVVGIAQDEGDLDIADPAATYIPAWKGTPSAAVTVRDLLSNDSGRFWSLASDYQQLVASADKDRYAIGLDQAVPPGETWAYNNSAIQTLDRVVHTATGEPFQTFGTDRLLRPIGMANSSFSTDDAGNALTFMGLKSTCRDMARFGQLLLQEGRWDGEQIVSSSYLDDATGRSSQKLNAAYGYLFWLNRKGTIASATSPISAQEVAGREKSQLVPGAPTDLVWALGLGGQIIQVHRPTDTVVVRLGPSSVAPTFGPADAARVVTEAVTHTPS